MTEKKNPIREVDEEAHKLVQSLLDKTKYAALGVKEIESSIPLVSRVAAVWSHETGLFFSASDLSVHSQCLQKDPTCSIMIGEPGKGDGLAYPRITFIGSAKRMANDNDARADFRSVFLQTHPKAAMYVDFLDFGFYPIEVERALLNGGFGKAYHLDKNDLSYLFKQTQN
ncbi:MAG: hypothetical protein AAGA53_06060 [Pseudomonadota bacterium]